MTFFMTFYLINFFITFFIYISVYFLIAKLYWVFRLIYFIEERTTLTIVMKKSLK